MKRLALFLLLFCSSLAAAEKPNILWFIVDDMSANFSCYGETAIQTPHVDRLAREGTKFTNAFVTAPVCSPCRSALITGMYQTSIGAHHHRSGRGTLKIHLPAGVEPVPALLQKAGYYTCIGSGLPEVTRAGKKGKGNGGLGKTDYNFEWDATIYDAADWSGRKAGQPFFMQVQLGGGKLRGGNDDSAQKLSQRAQQEFGAAVQPQDVTLPPYYPRDAVLLRDWAAYLDAARFTDKHVGQVLARLEQEGILENTLVVFMTDHGISHARGKQFLYNEGTHVPFVVRGPGIAQGAVREDLIEQIDLAALTLAAAGIPIPKAMHGRDVLAKDHETREAVFAARDRCDETVERIRSVRTTAFSTFAISIPSVRTSSRMRTRTAKASSKHYARCTLPPRSIRSPKNCSSLPRARRRSCMSGKWTVGRCKILPRNPLTGKLWKHSALDLIAGWMKPTTMVRSPRKCTTATWWSISERVILPWKRTSP